MRAEADTTALALTGLPRPLTAFIGRHAELETLAEMVRVHRFVTATGPGGVGKTRLSLTVAERLAEEFVDGVAFVDLVTVSNDEMVVAAVADAVGVPERSGVSRRDALLAALAERHCLVVVDNCEHLLAGARACIADIVAACPGARILATSRTRLLLAGETVFAVPGLSIETEAGGSGDAVELLAARVTASGMTEPFSDDDIATAGAICQALDGMALAIELAAARVPSFGLDGVRRALTEGHEFLTLGPIDGRHSSLRAAIEWSYHLLDEDDRTLLRTATVFAAPFDVEAAAAVAGGPTSRLTEALGRLVDWNLVSLRPGRPTRYRVLETIRQYGRERSADLRELDGIRERHLAWSRAALTDLLARAPGHDAWCAEVDHVMDDARAALGWAAGTERRVVASELAQLIAAVSFQRGHPGDAQQRYEQAADLADDVTVRLSCLRLAAGSALVRYVGDDAFALLERAVGEAARAGDLDAAALYLARLVTVHHRHDGTFTRRITSAETDAFLRRARQLSTGSAHVEVAISVAGAIRGDVPRTPGVARHAANQARACGDALLLDAALDQITASQLERGDLTGAADTVRTRLTALASMPIDAASGMDHADANLMGAHVDLSLGRLPTARRHADALAALPFLREARHVGLARRLEVDALAGEFDDVLRVAGEFYAGWHRAGRPLVNNFGSAAYAVAMVHGMRNDLARRDEWVAIARDVLRDPATLDDAAFVWPAVLDGLLLLDRDEPDAALARMAIDPDKMPVRALWYQRLWLPWYGAAWAEASALTDRDDHDDLDVLDVLDDRLDRASRVAGANRIAQLVIDRARAIAEGRPDDLGPIAQRLDQLGCGYQADRTRRLHDPKAGDRTTPHALAALSARERQVLRLVAAGHSNPQIAATLYISRKTAEHHVSNILTKLGVTSRAEAAALAGRHDLPPS